MRDRIIMALISALFLLLIAGLFYKQILCYAYYSKLSRNNSIRIIPIEGPRGNMYDRNGQPIVMNRLSFDVAIIYQEITDRKKLVKLLSNVLGMTGEQIIKAFEKAARRGYTAVTIAEDIDKDEAIALEEATFDVSGLVIETRAKREYIYKHYGCHLVGYLSQVTDSEFDTLKDSGYRVKDMIGRSGLEKYYERSLKGIDGGTQVEVDSRGRQTRVIGLKEPESGQDLYLTIDLPLQLACDKLLGDRKGAIVVMDPRNGEVLAIASHPTFDPNIFVSRGTSDERLALLADRTGRPMSNKAISGIYPPGSVFKIVTSSAALETKKIDYNTRFVCSGTYRLGRSEFDCWKAGGHGSQNVIEALMNSCNVFFYNTGRALGVDNLEMYTKLFGYGKPTGIDLPDEVGGIAPGRDWKRSRKAGAWFEGETLHYAIGQSYLLVTPLQVVTMTAVIANGGNLVRPHIARRIGSTDIDEPKPRNIGLMNSTIQTVRGGLFAVVNAAGGTGKRAKLDGGVVAGKTGTAQNPQGRTHAWFCGFAPYDNPKVCVVVFLEHGGKGGLEPAEIGHGVFEEAQDRGYLQ